MKKKHSFTAFMFFDEKIEELFILDDESDIDEASYCLNECYLWKTNKGDTFKSSDFKKIRITVEVVR